MTNGTCAVDGCENPAKTRGWCNAHYKRWYKYGDPLGKPAPRPVKVCRIEGCDSRPTGQGMCPKHYSRLRAGRDPLAPTSYDMTTEERFWVKVDKNGPLPEERPELGPCWVWTAGKTGDGYGAFGYGPRRPDGSPRTGLAHRFAYETAVGSIPEDLQLDHLCRRPACVRPSHLDPVTGYVNQHRSPITSASINSGKAYCPAGHEYSPENTRITTAGTRECKECRRDTVRRFRGRRRGELPPRAALPAERESELRAWVTSGTAKSLRRSAGMEPADAARVMSVGKATILHWEAGRSFPVGENAIRYYEFLASLNRAAA